MPGVTGLEAARRILDEHPEQAIVLFSAYLDGDVIRAAQRMGVRMCLAKDNIRQLPGVLWRTEGDPPRGGGGLL
jgi:DNA-binding NarL/FixJ family response regulator